ncbi:hypothetical protein AgCh_038938 [Apium graveolens]
MLTEMLKNLVLEETISQWDKIKFVEAAPAITLVNAQILFLHLKNGEQITKVARVDQRLVEDVQHLKTTLKARDDERKRDVETLKKIRSSESKLIKERDQLNHINTMDQKKDEATSDHARRGHELELKILANSAKDFMKSTMDVLSDLDWSKLGEDSANDAKIIRKEEAEEAKKMNPTILVAAMMEDVAPIVVDQVKARTDEPPTDEPTINVITEMITNAATTP